MYTRCKHSYLIVCLSILVSISACSEKTSITTGTLKAPVFYVEDPNGTILESSQENVLINPASVVKVATSLWAITQLGPEHRFETKVAYRGYFNTTEHIIVGDLLVLGFGDPDFHIENAYLLARELNRIGIKEIHGKLLVNSKFWIGWEGGSERREKDALLRAKKMAVRLQNSLNPKLWKKGDLRSIRKFEKRRGFTANNRPSIVVVGVADTILTSSSDSDIQPLFTHKSNSLESILKRFNSFSNNDIERLGDTLGTATELSTWLHKRWGEFAKGVSLETLSGLGSNRLSAQQIVHMLNDLEHTCINSGINIADILPVAGCDPGTVKDYPQLRKLLRGNMIAKTGTLWETDGGVSVLAGILQTKGGQRTFCVATVDSGEHIPKARAQQEQWTIDLLRKNGAAPSRKCDTPPLYSDGDVVIIKEYKTSSS